MTFKRFCNLSGFIKEQVEKYNTLAEFTHSERLVDCCLGIENIDDDLVIWYKLNNELDCWVMQKYFDYYLEYKDEQVFEMFIESVTLKKQGIEKIYIKN